MNLNKYDKQAFVIAVMGDVPQVDFNAQAETLVRRWEKAQMPDAVAKAVELHPEWIGTKHLLLPGRLDNRQGIATDNGYRIRDTDPDTWSALEAISEKLKEQNQSRNNLQAKLTAVIETCRTLKQAKERLPEFEKYLPKERGPGAVDRSMPMVSNLVADLNAAGWPKNGSRS